MKKIIYILLFAFVLIFANSCNKINPEDAFNEAVALGKEGNYTFRNDYSIKQNDKNTNYTLYNKFVSNGMSITTKDGMSETYLYEKDDKYFRVIKTQDDEVSTEITSTDYNKSTLSIFSVFEYEDFNLLEEGVYDLKEDAFGKYFNIVFTSAQPFIELEGFEYKDMYLQLHIENNELVKIVAGSTVTFKINVITQTYEYYYVMNFYDYGTTSIDLLK